MVNGAAMGVDCAPMTSEADQTGPARVSLPGVLAYLSSVYELGRRSLRPALPALALLFFYRLGTGAYGALTNYSVALKGHFLGGKVVASATPILLLALIYIPFLPLQESILRGRPIDFLGAIRRVLRVPLNLILSGIAQVLLLLGPILPIAYLGARLLPDPFGPLLWAGMAWLAVAAFFMVFATPAVVLDGEGPLHSLRTSFHLVSRNLGSALGRFLLLALLAFVGLEVATPFSTLGGNATAPIKLAVLTWTTAVETLLYPFWVAAIMVLYRSLRPWADDGRAVDGNNGVPMLNTKAALLGALVGAGILLLVAVLNPGWVEWINSTIIKPPVCSMRPTASPALPYSPVTGLTVQVNGMVLPSSSVRITPLSKPIVTIANSTSAAITVTSVALYERLDNIYRPEVDLAPPCKYMAITSDDCVTAAGPGTVAPGATCTIELSVPRTQSGYLLVDTSLGVLTIPIVARP
jgi:hypothetical protein